MSTKQTLWPDAAQDVLQIAFKDMPPGIVKTPAWGLKDNLDNYAIELPAHIVVAVKAPYSLKGENDHGSVVSIPRLATDAAERLDYEVIVYVRANQKYYLTSVSEIKQHYAITSWGQDRYIWVMPIKRLTEYKQAKANAMQGVLLL